MGKSRNALKTHLINAHFPEMHNFKCTICGYSTNVKSRFKCHLKEVHGKPPKNHSLDMMVIKEEGIDLDEDVGLMEESS